eukprot:scaffold652185_cov45-Prasinocladus_malaysianus.AAC.1
MPSRPSPQDRGDKNNNEAVQCSQNKVQEQMLPDLTVSDSVNLNVMSPTTPRGLTATHAKPEAAEHGARDEDIEQSC